MPSSFLVDLFSTIRIMNILLSSSSLIHVKKIHSKIDVDFVLSVFMLFDCILVRFDVNVNVRRPT